MFFQVTNQVNQKVFVSPGVYTSETDLSFVAQSVGVTTLGLVGETLKGPAFEPIFITNYDEYQTYFGGTVPEKFIGTQIPKYEAAYIAKAYLQQSNQLFVTRILGLSGYDAGPSWSIRITANPDCETIDINPTVATLAYTVNFSGNTTGGTTAFKFTSVAPALLIQNSGATYTLNDGSTSTIASDLLSFAASVSGNTAISGNTALVYGAIPQSDYLALFGAYPNLDNVFGVDNLDLENNELCDGINDPWLYANFNLSSASVYSGWSWDAAIISYVTGASNTFTGTLGGNIYTYSATPYTQYHNLVVATLRSRGISEYSATQHGPKYQVTGLTDVDMICTGPYSAVTSNPYATFQISGVTFDAQDFSFDVSMAGGDANYISKVLGITNFSKSRFEVPVYVEEVYPGLLNYGYNKSYVRGLNCDLVSLPEARDKTSTTSIAWYLDQYQTPITPWLVSELRGNKVFNLFRFRTISDGNSANTEVKISIANISFANQTFDVLVRDFFDTDANPIVYEKYTNCTMDPGSNSFVGKKIGSFDGEYPLVSTFVMVEMSDEAPVDALPCGFRGLESRIYGSVSNPSPFAVIKNEYFFPGQVIWDPPYGSPYGVNSVTSNGDVVRRSYLGISSQFGVDSDLLQYKGKQNPVANWNIATTSEPWNYQQQGFHMDSGATVVTIGNTQVTSGTPAFVCGVASFDAEPTSQDNPYYFLYSRKFTLVFQGGFDGWDIYRTFRTNQDRFALGASGYLQGSTATQRYPTASGDGTFKRIVVANNTQDFANTDYYAYLLGILSFNNPESTNINVFATPGIDYVNNSNLVELAIGMVENERADSVYITTTPDYNMYTADAGSQYEIIYPQEAVDNLDQTGIDSSYTATYYPWILERDTVNNTQIYIPPTGQVCRNLALTDNISFPWFASAGYTRGLVNSVKARLKLTQEDRDTLYQGRINPIATFSDVGTVIWGNKTLQIRDTALNRLNVRRLLLQARKLISAVAVRLLFEQNDEIVRQQFLDSVNPILDAIRRDRGLYDFRVTVASTPEDLDRNTLTGKIYLKPTKALEFIDIEFLITPTGASFENI
jgi:hypothetical protein